MSKSLYSEFPTNAHALGYGKHRFAMLIAECDGLLHGDRKKVSKLISTCKAAAEAAIKARVEV